MADLPEEFVHFSVLEDYLQQLQSGGRPNREKLLGEHPELSEALACLETLEGIAPDSADGWEVGVAGGHDSGSRLPRDFGPLVLLEEIGRGGMGVVYKARHRELDRIVAVKMILASHLASAEHVRRFQEEARAAARVEHPHIVHIHEVGQVEDQHYFTMQYVEGVSLAVRIARGPIEIQEAVCLVAQVARAVGHLHRHEIVHRDLKPSNILLDETGKPHVTDFGLAKVVASDSQATATGAILGTPSYMAPEQAAGQHLAVGPWSDIYSLGAVLYELLTGRPPFQEDTAIDTVLKVLEGEPPLPRTLNRRVPRALELVCLKCLAREPRRRYASADALADELERFLKGEPLAVRPPTRAQRLARWVRREPAAASRLGVLGIFFTVQWINFARHLDDPVFRAFHWKILGLIGVWTATAFLFQRWIKRPRWSLPACFVWGTLDSALLLAVLLLADGAASPLVVGYPLLIVASGLWMRERFVWFIGGLSMLSYAVLVADFYLRRPGLQARFDTDLDRHVIFAVMIAAVSWGVAYLVRRIRTLSSFYGR